ncbi:Werner syndrome ATP-dependent helicase-like protein [Bienertia sinuspersici]
MVRDQRIITHFVTTHGDHFLKAIKDLSQHLNMPLDGEVSLQNDVIMKVTPVQTHPKKLTPAKYEAWKMWHEVGHSIERIANFPGRSAPIKEGTVLSYLLEAFQEGLATDWLRFSAEIGLTPEMYISICDAVKKVGSTEKLKPIKDELPENISYSHIKASLTMLSSGFSFPSELNPLWRTNEVPSETAEPSPNSLNSHHADESCNTDHKLPKNGVNEECDYDDYGMLSSRKRCKVEEGTDYCSKMEATQTSIVEWLKNYDNGVALHDITTHFSGSSEENIHDLLVDLEGDFVIYQKNGVYKMF